jgi:hypothetical protein
MTRIPSASFALAALGVLASVSAAGAQSFPGAAPQAGGVSSLEAGYGGAGRVASQPFQPSTRDANGNRLVVNGRIIDSRGQRDGRWTQFVKRHRDWQPDQCPGERPQQHCRAQRSAGE